MCKTKKRSTRGERDAIRQTNRPRKQFKLKSPLSVTDGEEIQLEFQIRASFPRRAPIHNRTAQRIATTTGTLWRHDGRCAIQTHVRYTLGAWGPVQCYRHTKARRETKNGRSGFVASLIILYSPNVTKTRTCKINQRFMSQIAKWPFGFFRNRFGFL